ncbi:hypothetical protein [Streptomyces sp. NPDC029003]|uniref:hypothetical protein n=1 Tax=Streptomyces sp. NPDC029003 TaxID=3155125 RepID=UPI00340C1EA4
MFAGRGRSRARFGAVLVAVVMALTGFSTSGGSSGKSKSGGGHGCSSSKNSKSSQRTTSSRRSTSGGGGTGSGTATASPTASPTPAPRVATARVTSCGDASRPSTTVEVTSLLDRKATFLVSMYREAAGGAFIETATQTVTLDARATGTAVIAMADPARAGDVRDCRVSGVREAPGGAAPGASAPGGGPDRGRTSGPSRKPAPKATKPRG